MMAGLETTESALAHAGELLELAARAEVSSCAAIDFAGAASTGAAP